MCLAGALTILPRQICGGNSHFAETDEQVNDDTSLGALNSRSFLRGLVARTEFVMDLLVV